MCWMLGAATTASCTPRSIVNTRCMRSQGFLLSALLLQLQGRCCHQHTHGEMACRSCLSPACRPRGLSLSMAHAAAGAGAFGTTRSPRCAGHFAGIPQLACCTPQECVHAPAFFCWAGCLCCDLSDCPAHPACWLTVRMTITVCARHVLSTAFAQSSPAHSQHPTP